MKNRTNKNKTAPLIRGTKSGVIITIPRPTPKTVKLSKHQQRSFARAAAKAKTEAKKQTVTLNDESLAVLRTIQTFPEIRASLFFKGNKDSKVPKAQRFNFIPSRALSTLRDGGFVKFSDDRTYTITAAGRRMLTKGK